MDLTTYINFHVNKQNRANSYNIEIVIQKLCNCKPFVFTKFGDGEYQCMNNFSGHNCDSDKYGPELGDALRKAFVSLCDMSYLDNKDRILIGRWHYPNEVAYYSTLYWNHQQTEEKREIPFVDYHLIYNDDYFSKTPYLYNFVEAVQSFPHKKILITNINNKRLCDLFRIDTFITIQSNSWFSSQFNSIVEQMENILNENPDSLLLIAGGLASKVLIEHLCKKYLKASFLDIGSGFDILATRKCTRDHKHSYDSEVEYYKDLLPKNWESIL